MYRTFNSQVAAFIRHCMDEELHTIYVLEMQQTQKSAYVTFIVALNNLSFYWSHITVTS